MPIKVRTILKIKIMKELINRYQQVEKNSPFLLMHIMELETILKELL